MVDATCPVCKVRRRIDAKAAAYNIRRKTFTGRCANHCSRLGPKMGPYPPAAGVDYTQTKILPVSGGRCNGVHVTVTCPDCGNVRWKSPSVLRPEIRKGTFSARCNRCSTLATVMSIREGKRKDHRGYVLISRWMVEERLQPWFDVVLANRLRVNPRRFSRQVMEHHVVMANMIGRALLPYEVVHHKNGKRADNRPQNLRLYKTGEHHPGYGDFYQEWQEALGEIGRLKALTAPHGQSLLGGG